MSRSIVRVIAICFLVQGCGGQDGAAEPDTPDEGGAFASWDGATPTVDAAQPDVTPADGALPTETLEDVGPVEGDTHDAAADDTLDAEEAPEEVEAPPPPCETDEDCSDNDIANPCLRPACNPASGTCIEVDRPVGTPCETGDLCKANQVCQGGQCMGGTNLECADEDPCTTDMCDPAQGCIYQPVDDCCIPDCEGKACGTDGCGGTCGVCQADWSCNAEGTCINCVPNCIGLTCGVDGCGGVCGVCPDEWFCIDPGICMECLPDCVGKQCGPDGCGADCGTCGAGMECDGAFCSTCVADCEGKACGPNGCGGTCGNCAESATCNIFGECVCEPECEGKTCGDNGCGGTCGDCPVGDVCTFFNTCQAVTVAMVCDNPLIIPDVPFSTIQSTAGGTNLSEMTAGLCGFDSDVGGASPEHVYSFTPAEDGVFTFHVEPQTFDTAVYLVNDCSVPTSSCLAGSDEDLDEIIAAPLVGEKTYFLIVDGHNNLTSGEGLYSLNVYAGAPVNCTASCAGKVCGTDGCGGSCGVCAVGEECTSGGACEVIKTGDTCELPIVVGALPFSVSGNTSLHEPDYNISSGSCPGVPASTGQGSNDVVYTFTPEVDGNYLITVPTTWDVVVYIATDCAALSDTCVTFTDDVTSNAAESLVTYLLAGQTYFIILDGDSWNSNLSGEYTFELDTYVPENCTPNCTGAVCGDDGCDGYCGLCGAAGFCEGGQCVTSLQGDSCETAFTIDTVPFSMAGDTTGAHPDYSFGMNECPGKDGGWGLKGSDEVFHLSPPSNGTYQIDVEVTYDALVYLVTDCDDIASSCIVASDAFGTFTETIVETLSQGTDYFVIIDYWSNTSDGTGAYTIHVDQLCQAQCLGKACGNDGCGGSCGTCDAGHACVGGACAATSVAGESCDNPFEFTLGYGAYYANGDTTGASADETHAMTDCTDDGYAGDGPDHVYAVTALEDATYLVTLTIMDDDVDLGLWVATDCADPETTCLSDSDFTNFANSSEVVTFQAVAGQTYFVVVDSHFTDSPLMNGAYWLEFTAE